MAVNAIEYNRTFMHWPRKAVIMPGDIARMSRRAAEDAAKHRGTPPPTKDTRKFHQALELGGSTFREVQIEEKSDQKFEKIATPWELIWSRLIYQSDGRLFPEVGNQRLVPVVDGNAVVVGYCGDVKATDMLIGRATGMALVLTNAEVLKYHRMYVGAQALHAETQLSEYGVLPDFYTVLTDIYGEVTSFAFAYKSSHGTAQSTSFPVLGWLKLFQGGLKILMSVKNGFRTLGRQPPTPPPAPPPPPRALPPGRPATAPGGNAPRPGSQTMNTSQGAARPPAGRPRQVFDTGLGESINNVRRQLGLPPLPARTIGELHARARGVRADRDFFDWLRANPNAPWSEKLEVMNRINARWRVTGMPGNEW